MGEWMFKCSLYPHASPTAGGTWLRQLLPGRNREMHQVQGFPWSDLEATFIILQLEKSSFEIPCFHRHLPLWWSVCGITLREKGKPCPMCCACQCVAVAQREGSVFSHLQGSLSIYTSMPRCPVGWWCWWWWWFPNAFGPVPHLAILGTGQICTLTKSIKAGGQRSSCELGQKKKVK